MISRKLIVGALVLGGVLASGLAQARDNVQWSVSIGIPVGVPIYSEPYPVYTQPYPVYSQPAPVYVRPAPVVVPQPYWRGRGYVAPTRWDADGDGIPNRYDRVYNPRWDRDGDGIPNRYDRHDGNRYGQYRDRDRDGIPNWNDRHDNRGGGR